MPIDIRFEGDSRRQLSFDDAVEKIAIGRDPHCQITFPETDTRVGRRHCTLEEANGRYRIRVNQGDVVIRDGRRVCDGDELPLDQECKLRLGVAGPILCVRSWLPGVPTVDVDPQPSLPTQVRREQAAIGHMRLAIIASLLALGILVAVGFHAMKSQSQQLGTVSQQVGAATTKLVNLGQLSDQQRQSIDRLNGQLANSTAQLKEREPQLAELLRQAIPSVYLVLIQDSKGFLTREATAWVVDQKAGLMVTNAHVAAEFDTTTKQGGHLVVHAPSADAKLLTIDRVQIHPGYNAFQQLWDKFEPVEQPSAGKTSPVPLGDSGCDVALLHVANPEGLAPALKLADADTINNLAAGEPLGYVGYPAENLALEGYTIDDPTPALQMGHLIHVTDYFGVADGPVQERFLVSHSAPMTGGASGSPLLNRKGEVVAVNSGGNFIFVGPTDTVPRIPSAAMINYGQRIDLVQELLSNTADQQLATHEKAWQDGLAKHFRPGRPTERSTLVASLADQFKSGLAPTFEYQATVDYLPDLKSAAMDKVAGAKLPTWQRSLAIAAPGIYLIAAISDGKAPLHLVVKEPTTDKKILDHAGATMKGFPNVSFCILLAAAAETVDVSAVSESDVHNVYLSVLNGTIRRLAVDDLHQKLVSTWLDGLASKTQHYTADELSASRINDTLPPPTTAGTPSTKQFTFTDLPADRYLVTMVTASGDTIGLVATAFANDNYEATGSCLSHPFFLVQDGAISGMLTRNDQNTNNVDYQVRLYRAVPAAATSSTTTPTSK
jgi:Trypsin-like peptidase domain/FHA domain